ncbi:nitrogenase iron-molybdenum cofactor biosynthesis protein NifN [Roseomonas sp. NAR14]|uniref:Nitrogenase iron-molybdenum cofactor biosynthesis protein NifN n=1 Tax=Roseomonas acroporae TaxID=2937791 RepID=A0A9X1Y8F0_9PROT|nr:nitrogenase iron-molybdenum cofactor biosynthesis protein NifN [Roseomonas acroporae]MCK8784987.1 nitrogenase iron-molybdenum cofactor biosynthesis protein NifN [Roseomonas acroporae]
MAEIVHGRKACATNPLKSSAPLGAALAYLGMEGSVPLLHGSQGCTSFALTLAVRHFKEAIPLQTTAMDEVATILGGAGNLEEAILNLHKRMKPRFIGIASTALVETRGEDYVGELGTILRKNASLRGTSIVYASTPDYAGALEDGWSRAVAAIIDALVEPGGAIGPLSRQVNILPGVHQTTADIEEIVAIVEAFGLSPMVLPDISGSLDGTVPSQYQPTTWGGARPEQVARMGQALHTIAIGEHMRHPAGRLRERTGVPVTLFPTLLGLEAGDRLVSLLMELSGRTAPARLRRQRSQLEDAMLDGHFFFGGRRVAIGSDPDLLYGLAAFFHVMGAEVVAAVASTGNSALLERIPTQRVVIGDLQDLEDAAAAAGAELLVTNSHGRQAAERLHLPHLRVGFPIFDRIGSTHRCTAGYRGTRDLIFEVANIAQAGLHAHGPGDFADVLPGEKEASHACAPVAAG